MGVGMPRAVEPSGPGPESAALRSNVVQVCPSPQAPAHTRADGQRLSELLRAHYVPVWRTLRRLGVDGAFADDAAQEVFIVLSRKLGDVHFGAERTFLLSCAVRVAANYRRTARLKHERLDQQALDFERDPQPSAEQLIDQKRLRETLDEVLDGWPEDIRTAFVLFELEGLSVPEISQVTDTKLGTVASRLRRARELFQAAAKRLRSRATAGDGL
jgi:RNA polymerase sigma-70 factor, ECF subfamily